MAIFFDRVIDILEDILVNELFGPFFKSDIFKQYKDAAKLDQTIATHVK